MEQMLVHSGAFYILIPFLEIYSLKSFKFKFLNQTRIKIIGFQGFFLHTAEVWHSAPGVEKNHNLGQMK